MSRTFYIQNFTTNSFVKSESLLLVYSNQSSIICSFMFLVAHNDNCPIISHIFTVCLTFLQYTQLLRNYFSRSMIIKKMKRISFKTVRAWFSFYKNLQFVIQVCPFLNIYFETKRRSNPRMIYRGANKIIPVSIFFFGLNTKCKNLFL